MKSRSFADLFKEAQETDDYWASGTKIDIATSINSLLERKGLSRSAYARKIKASPAYVTKVLSGDENLTIEQMTKLARALDARLHIEVLSEDIGSRWYQVFSVMKDTCSDNNKRIDWQSTLKAPAINPPTIANSNGKEIVSC